MVEHLEASMMGLMRMPRRHLLIRLFKRHLNVLLVDQTVCMIVVGLGRLQAISSTGLHLLPATMVKMLWRIMLVGQWVPLLAFPRLG